MTFLSAIHTDPAPFLALLAPWMTRQRWFANKGALPVLEQIGTWRLETTDPAVTAVTHLLLDHTVGKPALYQVPLTYRSTPLANSSALVGEFEGSWVYDGPFDAAYTQALLDAISTGAEGEGDRMTVVGTRTAESIGSGLVSRVLSGEQSNTSIIFEHEGKTPVICKVFRALHDGENPDVVLQTALAHAGSSAVPPPVGHIVAEWSDRGESSGVATGHLAFAQQFLPGVQDAWRVALAAAGAGIDFSTEARTLGIAVAGVHATLATTMPTSEMTRQDVDAVTLSMNSRLAAAIAEVPELARFERAIHEVFTLAATEHWPAQQRIHGDFHLGQVLAVPNHGWVLVDFEGEPLRPMRERSKLDSPLRDVAGMLRSFDYVSGSLVVGGAEPALDWTTNAREAFEAGYSDASGHDLQRNRALVDAFEIDKALYETVYEARNRPGWLSIPVDAIERLCAGVASSPGPFHQLNDR
ncbi:MAG: phosphotransferase [Salinibacterium sp.]|nr:phosphotransferase [Salinibacterium sp.]